VSGKLVKIAFGSQGSYFNMVQIDIACFFYLFDTYCRAFRLFYDVAEILNSHGSEPAGRDLSLAQCSHQLSYSVFIDQRFLFFLSQSSTGLLHLKNGVKVAKNTSLTRKPK